jgi:hypothetical protein
MVEDHPRERKVEAPMLDNPEKTARLLDALNSTLPFEVELTPELVKYLQSKNISAGSQLRHIVSKLSYAGDEGGILCHIVPAEGREAVIVSLTHVRLPRSMLLTSAVADYQKHRVKKLKKQTKT